MKYRAEIDGLRAIAVLPVILFHAGVEVFSGGFVGVDVFLVISGYLITSIILKEHDRGQFSLINFYERRVRRILPALFTVIVACIPFAWFILAPIDFERFTESIVAATTFWSNIYFWSESGYFAPAAELSPLLHTWSLAVEEQYYLFFPIFVLITIRVGKKILLGLTVLGGLISLGVAQWGVIYEPSAVFYLLPTRCWELFIGALAAIYLNMKGEVSVTSHARDFFAGFGLLLIVIAIFVFDHDTAFPGAWALIPTMGTAFVILFTTSTTLVGRILSCRGLVGVGLISYSAYLWHQPILAFAKYQTSIELSSSLIIFAIGLTLVLSFLTWRYIEKPFRNPSGGNFVSSRNVWRFGFLGISSLVLMGLFLNNSDHYMSRLSATQKHFYGFEEYGRSKAFEEGTRYGSCFIASDAGSADKFDKDLCLKIKKDVRSFLLLGDSHAAHLWKALNEKYDDVNVLQANASGCRPTFPLNGAKYCTDLLKYVLEDFLPNNRIDGIIISARWEQKDLDGLLAMIEHLQVNAESIVVLGSSPEFTKTLASLLVASEQKKSFSQFIQKSINATIMVNDKKFRDSLAGSGAEYLSLHDAWCKEGCGEVLLQNQTPIIWDESHFTLEGAAWIVDRLEWSIN